MLVNFIVGCLEKFLEKYNYVRNIFVISLHILINNNAWKN